MRRHRPPVPALALCETVLGKESGLHKGFMSILTGGKPNKKISLMVWLSG